MATTKKTTKPAVKAASKAVMYYEGIGRRREAVARVRLHIVGKDNTATVGETKIKKGEIIVNNKPVDEVFGSALAKARYLKPLRLSQSDERFAMTVRLVGGGNEGQLEAMILGIARAIEKVDKEAYRPALKKEKLLTRDPRIRERRKPGTGGKARRAKQSPKR